jgi:hypothetical protein
MKSVVVVLVVRLRKMHKSNCAWAIGLGVFAVWDLYAALTGNELATSGYHRALRNPKTRWPTLVVTALTVKHLAAYEFLPQIDPYRYLGSAFR